MGALDAARGYKEESVRERAVSGLDESWVCEVLCASARRLTLDAEIIAVTTLREPLNAVRGYKKSLGVSAVRALEVKGQHKDRR